VARIFNAATGLRPTGWAISRASVGTYIDSTGVLRTAAVNTERVDYTYNGTLLGLAVEAARTTIIPSRYSNPLYGTVAASLTQGQADPAGGTLAALFTPQNNTGARAGITNGVNATGGLVYRLFMRVKAKDAADIGKRFSLYFYNSAFAGTISFTLTANWQTVSTTLNYSSGTIYPNMPGSEVGTNDLANMYVFGGELKAGADALDSYIDTGTNATGSRAADAYSFTLASGASALTYTFDDGSTQAISGLTGGSTYTIPTSLNRSRVMYIDDNAGAIIARRRPLILMAS